MKAFRVRWRWQSEPESAAGQSIVDATDTAHARDVFREQVPTITRDDVRAETDAVVIVDVEEA